MRLREGLVLVAERHLAQGEGRAHSTKKSGDHLAQGTHGARSQKSSGSHLEQGEGGARATQAGGSHTQPHPALTDMTSDKQGGTVRGHDRTNPNAGKRKGGNPMRPHPGATRSK
jgi:hypothetical protein